MVDPTKYVLKTEGKFLTVRKFSQELLLLCAVDWQDEEENAPTVYISKQVKGHKHQMAFCFERPDGSYSLKVDGSSLKLEKLHDRENPAFTESHWFEKTNIDGSMKYSLRSVVNPDKSLSLDCDSYSLEVFILSDTPAPITEKMVA